MKQGQRTQSITEFIDIFPTLLELCGLEPLPQLEGKSFVPVLKNENHMVKDFAVSKWQNGITLKSGNYAYTEWRENKDQLYARMLFDHAVDPDENNNIAELPENDYLVNNLLNRKLLECRGDNYFVD
jgi:arylsulfatase A-like enzyme